ncbi:MAG: hypothetical protein J4G03_07330 [Gemmatimonadetes bacterium]|nr:hypothetical protein [Gemmatimonadota bacterium]
MLEVFYGATDGEKWNDNTNWLTDEPLGDWYGVSTDAQGNVLALDLGDNALTGSIPAELGNLESLSSLLLHGNSGLTGPLPNDLTGTPLHTFHWYDTGLCAPTDAAFQAWLDSIRDEQGAGDCS